MKTKIVSALTNGILAGVIAITAISANAGNTFPKTNEAIKTDAVKILNDKAHIKVIKQQLKKERMAENNITKIALKSDLRKAKADLKKDRMYFYADKCALKNNHASAINTSRKAVMDDRAEIRKAKRQLRKDTRKGDETAMINDVKKVAFKQKILNISKNELAVKKDARNSDLTAMHKERNKTRNESLVAKYSEKAMAQVENVMLGESK